MALTRIFANAMQDGKVNFVQSTLTIVLKILVEIQEDVLTKLTDTPVFVLLVTMAFIVKTT